MLTPLSGSPLKHWPTREQVHDAVVDLAARLARVEPRLVALGYFGSYVRGDWGTGSDLDLVIVVDVPPQPGLPPLLLRPHDLPWTKSIRLPVPHDLFLYSSEELIAVCCNSARFARVLREETRWVHGDAAF